MQEELEKDKSLNEIQKLEKHLCALLEKYHDIGLNRIYELSQKYPGPYSCLLVSVNNGWRLAKEYLRKVMEEGRIKEISVPVAIAMVKGTVQVLWRQTFFITMASLINRVKILMKGIQK